MSNIDTWFVLKIGRRLSSALIIRRCLASCRLFRLMYAQSFLVISVRGAGVAPTTFARSPLGVIAFMKAGFGARFVALFFLAAGAFFAAPFFAAPLFFAAPPFFAAPFFAAPPLLFFVA